MSKKILQENTIRRFMKLASIGGPSDSFIKENFVTEEEEEFGDAPAPEMGMGEDPEADEPPAEDPLPEPEGEPGAEEDGDMELSDEEAAILVALGRKLEAAGVEPAEEAGEPEPELDAEEEPELDAEEEPAPEDPGAEAPEEEEELMEEEGIEVVEEDDFDNLVNEVMKRVTSRIIRERLKK